MRCISGNPAPRHTTTLTQHITTTRHTTTLTQHITTTQHNTQSLLHPNTSPLNHHRTHTPHHKITTAPAHHHIITLACTRTPPHHHSRMHQYAQANSPTSIECEENIHPCTYSHAATNTQSKQMDGGSTHTAHIHSWTEGAHIHTAHIHSTCSILHTQVITHAPPPCTPTVHTHAPT